MSENMNAVNSKSERLGLGRRSMLLFAGVLMMGASWGCNKTEDSGSGTGASASGSSEAAGGELKFAFVTNNSSDFWNIAEKGIEKARKDFDVKVEVFRPLKGEVSDQQKFLEDIQVLGFKGVAISPINPDAMTPILDKVAAKMPLICHDSDAPKSKRNVYVGTNNVEAGKAAGKAAVEAVTAAGKTKGKVALFVGRIDMQNSIERKKGVEEELAKLSDLEILPVFLDNTDRAKAKKNVEDALVRYPDLVLAIGLWSYNGPAIAGAVRESAREEKPIVITFDEEEETLKSVEDGLIRATIVQKPFEFGYQSVRLLKELSDGKQVPSTYDTGIVTVKQDNLKAFWDELKELKK
jgi:ribose transport system substrate-binding protein